MDSFAINWNSDALVNDIKQLIQDDLDESVFDKTCVERSFDFITYRTYRTPFECATLNSLLRDSNLLDDLSHAQIFIARPGIKSKFHVDGLNPQRKAAINIPISGCKFGVIEWSDASVKGVLKDLGFTSHWVPETPLGESVSSTCSLAEHVHVVKTDKWHRLNLTDNPEWRVVFSLRFMSNPSFEELVEKLIHYAV